MLCMHVMIHWMLDVIVTFQNGAKQTLGMLDAMVTFQDGADLEPTNNLFSLCTAACCL